jgi:murein DD-endopeptidase MepM/ murein hydrolase activator NlpD
MRKWAWAALALVLCVAFVHFCVRIVPGDAPVPAGESSVREGHLLIPVKGMPPGALVDTFMQAREKGERSHDAIDIMAARGRAVLAVADGRIERIHWSERGGRTIYQRSGDGAYVYYYAHLDAYAAGLTEGQAVRRGQRIATVGSTGNADPAGPHLHFEVHEMGPGDPWYRGRPVNPYPLLTAGD